MDPYDWLNKFYSCYMATVAIILIGVALSLICVMETNPISISKHCIRHLFTVAVAKSSYT